MITGKNVRSHQVMLSTHMIGMAKAAAKAEAIPEGARTPIDREIIISHEREQKVFLADVQERTAELPKEIVKAPVGKKPVIEKAVADRLKETVKAPTVKKVVKHGKAKSK
jgi:hypothetical protein